MNVVDRVSSCLQKWPKGGETEWHVQSSFTCYFHPNNPISSRNFLLPAHLNPTDTTTVETLSTAYHTLLYSVLRTWAPSSLLTPQSLVDFVQSVLVSLPSSSVQSRPTQSDALFGELLVDIVWSLDAQLDELVTDAKAIITTAEQTTEATDLHKATGVKQTAEQDKELLVDVVKKLLVSISESLEYTEPTLYLVCWHHRRSCMPGAPRFEPPFQYRPRVG